MAANERSDLKLHLQHAPIEIERKFLIANDAWKHSVVGSVSIRDGLIASYKSRKVRVRISDQIAVTPSKVPIAELYAPNMSMKFRLLMPS